MKMKSLSIMLTSALLNLAPTCLLAKEKPLQSKLVVISANTNLEKEDNSLQNLFNHSSNPAIRLTFMVKAKNIVQVLENSVTTNSKTPIAWKCGSFPRVSKEGDAAAFTIEKKGSFLGKADETKVEGSIEIQTGSTLETKSFSLFSFDEPFRMDDFIFTLLEDKLKVEGNHKLIKDIIVEYKNQTLKTSGSSWSDNYRTYNFKGIGEGVKITFSYWDGIVTRKVHFSKK